MHVRGGGQHAHRAEDDDTCQSWTLNNPTELWVSSITQRNDGGYHHANWFFVPDDQFALPDGAWRSRGRSTSEAAPRAEPGPRIAVRRRSGAQNVWLVKLNSRACAVGDKGCVTSSPSLTPGALVLRWTR